MLTLFSFWAFVQRPHLLTLLLVLLGVSAWGQSASAATLNVPGQYPNIQVAVNAAANGDTVLIADGTYSGDGNRDIDFNGKNLTVTSQHGAASTVIDCGGSSSANHRGFYIHRGETSAIISGLTIKNGYVENVFVNADSGDGGAICINGSSVSIQNCNVSGNTAYSVGGGIATDNSNGTVTLTGCALSGNSAQDGGGVYNSNDNGNSTTTLTGCTVSGNTAHYGGGVYNGNVSGNGRITLTNCTVSDNTAQQNGGGVSNFNLNANGNSTIALTNCTISGNSALSGVGGGVENDNGNRNYNSVNANGTITLTGCAVTGNTAQYSGGGVSNSNDNGNGTITLAGCTVSGNAATEGGGVYNEGTNNNDTTVYRDFIIALTNCTVTKNTARYGGGICNSNSYANGIIMVINCTLTGNAGQQSVGSVYNYNGNSNDTIMLTNCILLGDSGVEVANSANTSSNAVAAYCDIQGGYPGTGNINADPLFVNATTDLHLQPGSLCLGEGTSAGAPATDKDGKTRPSPPSIGAYEVATSHTHLLWNNSDGRVMLWSVAADGSFTLNGFGPYTDNAPQNKWSATAVATGADGKSHLLWNNTDGRVMLWTVDDAGSFTLAGYGPYTDNAPQNKWSAVGVSVGPDNVVHLLWSNTDRRAMLWNVASDFSFTLAGYGPYTDNAPQNLWSATALSTGPDNVQHILWSNTDRRAMFWNVASDFSFTLAGYGPYTDGAPQNLWTATAVATGPDNMSHLLWDNTDYRAMLWGVDNAFNFSVAGYGPYTDNAPGNLWSATAVSAGP